MHTDKEIDTIEALARRFYDVANANGRGYVKWWKACSIVWEAYDIARATGVIDIKRSNEGMQGSLQMEGFTVNNVDAFSLWLCLELKTAFAEISGEAEARDERIKKGSSRRG